MEGDKKKDGKKREEKEKRKSDNMISARLRITIHSKKKFAKCLLHARDLMTQTQISNSYYPPGVHNLGKTVRHKS